MSKYALYAECPPKMQYGGTSIKTDFRSKNDTFYEMKGTSENSFYYREYLQNAGLVNLTNEKKYTTCNIINCDTFPSNKMSFPIDSTGPGLKYYFTLPLLQKK